MTNKIQGAIVEEQGVKFAIVVVKKHIIDYKSEAEKAVKSFSKLFPGMNIMLAAQDYNGRFTYYGRQDISKFLASIDSSRIPWQEYTFS
jgi:hypothetical protein